MDGAIPLPDPVLLRFIDRNVPYGLRPVGQIEALVRRSRSGCAEIPFDAFLAPGARPLWRPRLMTQ
jgi:hypothetical protein